MIIAGDGMKYVLFLSLFLPVVAAHAHKPGDKVHMSYIGMELGVNTLERYYSKWDSSVGVGVNLGADLSPLFTMHQHWHLFGEFGFADSGTFVSDSPGLPYSRERYRGLWFGLNGDYAIAAKLSVLGKAGVDLGDDAGYRLGFGPAYRFTKQARASLLYHMQRHVSGLHLGVNVDLPN